VSSTRARRLLVHLILAFLGGKRWDVDDERRIESWKESKLDPTYAGPSDRALYMSRSCMQRMFLDLRGVVRSENQDVRFERVGSTLPLPPFREMCTQRLDSWILVAALKEV
jgi:hypothetical protein